MKGQPRISLHEGEHHAWQITLARLAQERPGARILPIPTHHQFHRLPQEIIQYRQHAQEGPRGAGDACPGAGQSPLNSIPEIRPV